MTPEDRQKSIGDLNAVERVLKQLPEGAAIARDYLALGNAAECAKTLRPLLDALRVAGEAVAAIINDVEANTHD